MSQGFIFVYRELIDKPIWQLSTPEQKTVLTTIMLMVNYKHSEWEFKGERYTVKPGQMITSLESIKNKCGKGISIQNVRTALKRFEECGFLTSEPTNKNRLITIVNWGFYQPGGDEANKQTNKQLTTNNNSNNIINKKDKEISSEKPKQKKYNFDNTHMKIAKFLFERIQGNFPNVKEPNFEAWANDVRLMMDRDNRSKRDIHDVILWAANDTFWRKNVLSTDKLRKQFDKLLIEMQDDKNPKPKRTGVKKGGQIGEIKL